MKLDKSAAVNILQGVRIVEIADEIAGPYCGKLFADVGAEVIKVESPDGDRLRRRGTGRRADDDGALFTFLNAGKRSARRGLRRSACRGFDRRAPTSSSMLGSPAGSTTTNYCVDRPIW